MAERKGRCFSNQQVIYLSQDKVWLKRVTGKLEWGRNEPVQVGPTSLSSHSFRWLRQHLPHCGSKEVPVFRWQPRNLTVLGVGVLALQSHCLALSLTAASEKLHTYITCLGLRTLLCKIKVISVCLQVVLMFKRHT